MTDRLERPAPWQAIPVIFKVNEDRPEERCFGWFHAAQAPARGVGLVLCRPIGYEAICANGMYRQLAETLAQSGFDVLRFDYHGTGDSTGDDVDPDRVSVWMDSIVSAVDEVRRLAGVSRVALFGMRLGATLAARVAARLGGVESLVMWAPCASGRAFARELRAASVHGAAATGDTASATFESLGFRYTAQTMQDLEGLDCQSFERPPAKNALILGRDDLPGEGPLPRKYRELGMLTTYDVVPGYAQMMAEPLEALLSAQTLDLITQWLVAAHPAGAAHTATPASPAPCADGFEFNGLREIPVRFGPDPPLFGILSEPAHRSGQCPRSETAVLMLNVGGNYRIGPSRIYVRMARALAARGYRAFRFDLAGLGDSPGDIGFSRSTVYSRDATAEVKAAIDFLASRGCQKFHVMGICSGSFVAFQSALADARVTSQILLNSRMLEWNGEEGGQWQAAMQKQYKSTHLYRRAMLQPEVYRRLLRGEIDVTGIAKRCRVVLAAHLTRALDQLLHRSEPEDSVRAKVVRLGQRGTDTLMIMAAEDDGRDYVEFHFGNQGSRMQGHPYFRMVVVEDSDHTFSGSASQQRVIATIQEHLEKMLVLKAGMPLLAPQRDAGRA